MLPLSLDLTKLRVALVGNGAAAARRLAWLDEAGAPTLSVFSETPSAELSLRAGARLTRRLPNMVELSGIQLLFIADLPEPQRGALAPAARALGVILHVEDAPALSDIHAPAVLRRGDLTIAVSTNGAAPGLAAELKQYLGGIFGSAWRGRIDELRELRRQWHRAGASHETVRRLTAARIARHGWLKARRATAANDAKACSERGGSHVSESR